ncbi:MAG: aminodeoxychorismate synthase, component I [Comamonadaceae bacterium PBBC2]|nr:MAG: aminodeoxychorismate synthase, component I [Comamonadaceae bacterium PBBC2]
MQSNTASAFTPSALIDFADPREGTPSATGSHPRLRHAFGAPRRVLRAMTLADVRPLLDAVESEARRGAWCVGYLRYEAAPAFDPAFTVHATTQPLAWFAVYDEALPWPAAPVPSPEGMALQWQSLLTRPDFDATIGELLQGIAQGDYYQVNYTAPLLASLTKSDSEDESAAAAIALFHALQRAQAGGYAAYLNTGDEHILSVSPELFFDWQDGLLLTRPMKGTAPRGATPEDDLTAADALKTSPKERAENVMIVDLLRNDLSRIAKPFSVQVPRLFHTQALPAVWQMTSDITARTRADCSLADVFAALFPCGSITGAPKVQAMRAIRALEPQPRGVYCGALGVVKPGGAAIFNVPIRTVTLRGGQAQCSIGSGITSGSVADDEWNEWQHKQAFVRRATTRFELLETLGLRDGQLQNLSAHLARMAQAALHFGYPWQQDAVEATLQTLTNQHATGAWRVRLLLDALGRAQAQAYALPATPTLVRLQLADRPLEEAQSEFVRFKTTNRPHYDAFTPTDAQVFDTVLWNAQREITECTRGNIALQLNGQWLTPPLRCGLLPGVGRAQALQEGRVTEAVVRLDDLPAVTAMAFLNSLRGWVPAQWATP